MRRTVAEWDEIARGKSAYHLAAFILADLTGYRSRGPHEDEDTASLASALEAYAEMHVESFQRSERT